MYRTWLQFVSSAAVIEHSEYDLIQTAAEVLFLLDYMQSAEGPCLSDISVDQWETDTHHPCLQAKYSKHLLLQLHYKGSYW